MRGYKSENVVYFFLSVFLVVNRQKKVGEKKCETGLECDLWRGKLSNTVHGGFVLKTSSDPAVTHHLF